jgi:hypothetical protein
MALDDGLLVIRFPDLSDDILENAAVILLGSDYSPVIQTFGEEFLTELKNRTAGRPNEWHEINFRKFSEAELILAKTQLEVLRDEAPFCLESFFSTSKFTVENELRRRATPERQ